MDGMKRGEIFERKGKYKEWGMIRAARQGDGLEELRGRKMGYLGTMGWEREKREREGGLIVTRTCRRREREREEVSSCSPDRRVSSKFTCACAALLRPPSRASPISPERA